MRVYQTKDCSLPLRLKDIDEKGRTVTFYASAFGNKDLDGDIIIQGAFKKSVSERGPAGTGSIRHLAQHSTRDIVGKPLEMEEDATGLLVRSTILKTTLGNDYLELYKSDVLQHSIGFVVEKGDPDTDLGAYIIREVKLYEVSAVTWGANPNTPTVGIKSLADPDTFKALAVRAERLKLAIKSGKFTDEMFVRLEAETQRIKTLIDEVLSLRSPEPPPGTQGKGAEPSGTDLFEAFSKGLNL